MCAVSSTVTDSRNAAPPASTAMSISCTPAATGKRVWRIFSICLSQFVWTVLGRVVPVPQRETPVWIALLKHIYPNQLLPSSARRKILDTIKIVSGGLANELCRIEASVSRHTQNRAYCGRWPEVQTLNPLSVTNALSLGLESEKRCLNSSISTHILRLRPINRLKSLDKDTEKY
jgi:hypothetical protein